MESEERENAMASMWKGEAAKLRRRVLTGINNRVPVSRAGVGITALRDVARLQVPEIWQHQFAKAVGVAGLRAMNADTVSALLYAAAWCRAYGRDMSEYLATFGASGAREV